jgi:glutamine amidotransferase
MDALRSNRLVEALEEQVRAGVPLLGICLGMHLLANASEEGTTPGFGWIPAIVRRIDRRSGQRVPHLGWNSVHAERKHPLFDCLPDEARYYFAHSYQFVCDWKSDVLGVTRYGDDFVSAVQRENVLGVQFHPEKSHRYGQELLARFLQM